MRKHWSERLSCQCGKVFRSMSAEAVHRHNFPALCRRKKRADWEVIAGLEWQRVQDGHDKSDRLMWEYHAGYKNIKFHIMRSTDAGFGISVFDHGKGEYLTSGLGGGIEWRRTRKNCQDRAVEIMAVIRKREKENGE